MRIYNLIIILTLLFTLGCSKGDEVAPISPCKPSTENYLFGEIFDRQECWKDNLPYRFISVGSHTCGPDYVNHEFQSLSMGLYIYEESDTNSNGSLPKRGLTVELPLPCDAFSTKEKFYNLLKVGKYGYLKDKKGNGEFVIKYRDSSGQYSTLNSQQNDTYVEILEVEPVPAPGGRSELSESLKVKMKISCLLADDKGKIKGRLEDVEISGSFSRMIP